MNGWIEPVAGFGLIRQYANMEHSPLHIRRADRTDLPALLDLYQHLAPGDERPTAECADEIFDRFATYEGSAILLARSVASWPRPARLS